MNRHTLLPLLAVVAAFSLATPANASPASEAPTAALAGTWRSYTCGDCFTALAIAPDGGVWGGTSSGGVTRWDPRSGQFKRYTSADGLAGDWVNDVAVDTRGDVWAAVWGGHWPRRIPVGLSHFDGTRWTTITTADGLPNLVVTDLAVEPGGGVWAASATGVGHFDGTTWHTYTDHDGLPNIAVTHVAVGSDGTVWCSTDNGLARFEGGAWRAFAFDGAWTGIASLAVDGHGAAWLAPAWMTPVGAGAARFDGQNWTHFGDLLGGRVATVTMAPDGAVWALEDESRSRIARFDGSAWQPVPDLGADARNPRHALAIATNGTVYTGGMMHGQLDILESGRWRAVNDRSGPTAVSILGLTIGPDDSAWVTPFESAYTFVASHPTGDNWSTVRGPVVKETLYLSTVVAFDTQRNLWLANESTVARYDGSAWRTFTPTDGTPAARTRALATDNNGGMWVGSDSAGAAHWDGAHWSHITTADGLVSDSIRAILVDVTGAVWFGTMDHGVQRWSAGHWTTYSRDQGLVGNDVWSLAQDHQGHIWAAGHSGISRFADPGWTAIASPLHIVDPLSFVSLTVDNAGGVWHAITDGGAAYWSDGQWTTVTSDDGLASDDVFGIGVTQNGHVWFATILGVSEFIPGVPSPSPGLSVCPLARNALPPAVLSDALANPSHYEGWQQPLNPGKPVGPFNPLRTSLTLHNPNLAYHPLFNGPVWRVGCP